MHRKRRILRHPKGSPIVLSAISSLWMFYICSHFHGQDIDKRLRMASHDDTGDMTEFRISSRGASKFCYSNLHFVAAMVPKFPLRNLFLFVFAATADAP
jgi:hypothetical protein